MNYNNKTYMLPSWCVSFPSPAYRRPCVSLPFSMLVLYGVEWSGVTHIARKGTREKSTRGGHALQILHVGKAPWRKVAVQYTQYLISCWVSKPNINLYMKTRRRLVLILFAKYLSMNNLFKQELL